MHENTDKRRQDLKSRYYFLCKCEKCEDSTSDYLKSSLLCPNCNGCVPFKTKKCIDCKIQIDSSLIEQYENLKSRLSKLISRPREIQVLTFENFYNKAIVIFHPYDKDFMKFLNSYQSKLCHAGHYPRCLDVTKLMLINRYQNLPPYEWNIGIEELNAAKFCSILGKFVFFKIIIKHKSRICVFYNIF